MITLSNGEIRALLTALDNYLPELRYELSRIERPRERHGLVVFEQELSTLKERLAAELAPARPGAPPLTRP